MTTAAKSAAAEIPALADTLAMLADRLTALLARESALVRAMRVAEIGELQAEKTALTARYQETFNALVAAHRGAPLPLDIKERLARSGQRLGDAVAENELALRVGRLATERLITTIVAAVKEQQQSAGPYAPPRSAAAPRRGFMTAAALDRRL
jgi:hypothetical protein